MQNEMPDVAAYVVSQKGIYRTEDLIEHAEKQLTLTAQSILSAETIVDIQQAGKCLAYELATACTFHLWRAIETTMGQYFVFLGGRSFEDAKVQRNWAAKIKVLIDASADQKITAWLDHIRDKYRNPQTHPDEVVEIDEAQRLFSVALSSIEQMLLAIKAAPSNQLALVGGGLGKTTASSAP